MEEYVGYKEYEANQKALWSEIKRIGEIIEGPPHPGLEKRMDTFLTRFETLEEERETQHKQNRFRLNTIIAILGVIAAYLVLFLH